MTQPLLPVPPPPQQHPLSPLAQARPGSGHADPATDSGSPERGIQSAGVGAGAGKNHPTTLKKLARRLNRLTTAILQDGQAFEELPEEAARQVSEGLEAVEKGLKRARARASHPLAALPQSQTRANPRTSRRRPSGPVELRDEELIILKWLREKKFATTSHIKSHLVIERATDRLRELEKAGLLSSYRYQVHKGRQSEKCYWLSYAGAKYLTERGIATRYESRYVSRPPSEYVIRFRTLELEVPFEARRLGWKVTEPKFYNSARPRPKNEPSEQARLLMELLARQEQRESEQARRSGEYNRNQHQAMSNSNRPVHGQDYQARKHLQIQREIVPSQANHHVCYLPQADRAIIFILCPEDITGQFWEARIKEYGELAQRVKTFGVFYTRDQATAWLELLNETGIGVVSLEKLPQVLRDITYEYSGQKA